MYRMYLDEHGVDKMSLLTLDKYRYLSLTGLVMRIDHARDYLVPALNRIKAEVFNEDPDSPICFHRSDIRQSKGPFECLKDPDVRSHFDEHILRVFKQADYTVITVLADKQTLSPKHHGAHTHPYHVLMEVIIEKYAQLLERKGSIGDVMPEARSKPQDKALQDEFSHFKEKGTRFAPNALVQKRIPSSKLKFRTKKHNVAGLQLCDLLAHPSHYIIRHKMRHSIQNAPFRDKVSKILMEQKYGRSECGNIWGYGATHIP